MSDQRYHKKLALKMEEEAMRQGMYAPIQFGNGKETLFPRAYREEHSFAHI